MDDHELQSINVRGVEHGSTSEDHDLPRVDGGLGAWLVLASVFVQGALVWGKKMPDHFIIVSAY